MIVMKFGGSSVDSGEAIERLVRIVKEQLARKPVVVVSAMGKTTNRLLELTEEAARGHVYFVSKHVALLRDFHFDEAGKVAGGEALDALEVSLQKHFRDLHTILSEIGNEGRELTPALRDEIASFGERLSSEVVTAALITGGVPSVHLDARQVILTDEQHTHAVPLYWETYAKLRRVVPPLANDRVVVMAGFIASSETGAPTTLGRGGSDLTASIVGAGISADEIQIWTDVDGMLTCDPRVLGGGFRLKSISYEEASAMAAAGAKVLHPDSVLPAVRQLIPIVIRNSRKPEVEGTRIGPATMQFAQQVKSISCRQHQTVLEIRGLDGAETGARAEALVQLCARQGLPAELIGQQDSTAFLAIGNDLRYEQIRTKLDGCIEVHLRTGRAILTLVGDRLAATPDICIRAVAALKKIPASVISPVLAGRTITLIVPQAALERCTRLLHREFFKQMDPAVFAKVHEPSCDATRRRVEQPEKEDKSRRERAPRLELVRQN
jgi:aspartate kinase